MVEGSFHGQVKHEILGETEDEESGEEGEEEEEEPAGEGDTRVITDMTEQDLVNLRRTIYLTYAHPSPSTPHPTQHPQPFKS